MGPRVAFRVRTQPSHQLANRALEDTTSAPLVVLHPLCAPWTVHSTHRARVHEQHEQHEQPQHEQHEQSGQHEQHEEHDQHNEQHEQHEQREQQGARNSKPRGPHQFGAATGRVVREHQRQHAYHTRLVHTQR